MYFWVWLYVTFSVSNLPTSITPNILKFMKKKMLPYFLFHSKLWSGMVWNARNGGGGNDCFDRFRPSWSFMTNLVFYDQLGHLRPTCFIRPTLLSFCYFWSIGHFLTIKLIEMGNKLYIHFFKHHNFSMNVY